VLREPHKAHVAHVAHVTHVATVAHVTVDADSRELEGVLVLVLVAQGATELLVQLHGHLLAAAAAAGQGAGAGGWVVSTVKYDSPQLHGQLSAG
jgi:hypothetical protein